MQKICSERSGRPEKETLDEHDMSDGVSINILVKVQFETKNVRISKNL